MLFTGNFIQYALKLLHVFVNINLDILIFKTNKRSSFKFTAGENHIVTAQLQSNLTQLNTKLVLQGYWCLNHHPTPPTPQQTFRQLRDNLGS